MSLRLTSRRGRSLAAVCTGLALGAVSLNPAWAEGPRSNAVSFQTTATEEVTQDLMSVTLQVTRDGAQAAQVQAALKQVLETALAQAKRAAVPGGMDVRTGQFSVNPRYGNNAKINGWQGQARLILEGTDTTRIAQTAGQLEGLNIVNVAYGLSRALRERNESDLTAQAIERFRQRAQELTKAFGFTSYTLGEVSVQSDTPGFEVRPMMMAARAMKAEMDSSPLPVEPGKGILNVTVSGSIVMGR